MLPQLTVYAKIIYLLMVVMSGALCTVEDYVIMSQCAHNKAIHLAAEGTVSVTDISQTQNITIVGLPDFVNNDFKIALYAKETQRYLCFNEHWKLVGMKELRDTCYFNETIVHGYFVFRSVVDLKRRIGFTQRGKAVGPKKNVNDACYMFTKIPTDQFFHQHMQQLFAAHRRNGNPNIKNPPKKYYLENSGNGSGSGSGRGSGGGGGGGRSGGNGGGRDDGGIYVPTKGDKREGSQDEFGSGQQIERSKQYNRHKNPRLSIPRNNNKTNIIYRRHQYEQQQQQQQQQQHKQKQQQQQEQQPGQQPSHISNLSLFKQNNSELSSSNRKLAVSNYGSEQFHVLSPKHYPPSYTTTTTITTTTTTTTTNHSTHSHHSHQVRHHHNDPNAMARRHQHEQKLKRKQQQLQQYHLKPSPPNASIITTTTTITPTTPTTIKTDVYNTSAKMQTRTQTAFNPLMATMDAFATKSFNKHLNISKDVKLTTTQQSATILTTNSNQQYVHPTKRTVASITPNKRKGRRKQSERIHRKHMQQHLQQRLQHEREHIYLLESKTLKQHIEPPSTTPHTWIKPTLLLAMSTTADDFNQDAIWSTQVSALPTTQDDISYSSTTRESNPFLLSNDSITSTSSSMNDDNHNQNQNLNENLNENENENEYKNENNNNNNNDNNYGSRLILITTLSEPLSKNITTPNGKSNVKSLNENHLKNAMKTNLLSALESNRDKKMDSVDSSPYNSIINYSNIPLQDQEPEQEQEQEEHGEQEFNGTATESGTILLMELGPPIQNFYDKFVGHAASTIETIINEYWNETIEPIDKLEQSNEVDEINEVNEVNEVKQATSDEYKIENATLTTSNVNLINAHKRNNVEITVKVKVKQITDNDNEMNDINSTYMTLPNDNSSSGLNDEKMVTERKDGMTSIETGNNEALTFNNTNIESTYQTVKPATSLQQPFIKMNTMNTTNSMIISSLKSMTDYIYRLHINNTLLSDNYVLSTATIIHDNNKMNHQSAMSSKISKSSMASMNDTSTIVITPLLNDTLLRNTVTTQPHSINNGPLNNTHIDNMLPLTTALTLFSTLPNNLRNVTSARNRSLRNFTQKLLATPFHQLIKYVRNKDGDIDIDNIDNIRIYPDILSLDGGKINSIYNVTNNSSQESLRMLQKHQQQQQQQEQQQEQEQQQHQQQKLRSQMPQQITDSRLTMISGYFPTSATAILPESIRLAKIKINRERKRLLNLRNYGNYT